MMLIWTHVAVGYLLISLGNHYYMDRTPAALPTLAVVAGAVFPDVVDKPLALAITDLPGRSLAHSVFTISIVLGIAWVLGRDDRNRRSIVIAWTIGYLSHIVVDSFDYFIYDHTLRYLFWPVLSQNSHVHTVSDLLRLIEPTPYVILQTILTVAAIALWMHDGVPGVALIRSRLFHA
jgi:membrane-bound metal-dependent hydrolase YbcI (DUF457 family)